MNFPLDLFSDESKDLTISLFYDEKVSPSQQYKLIIEQKRVRFTNLILCRGLIIKQNVVNKEDDINSAFGFPLNPNQSEVSKSKDLLGDIYVKDVELKNQNRSASNLSPNQIIVQLDITRKPENFWFTWVRLIDESEYLLTANPDIHKKGAILIAPATNEVIAINTPFEWNDAIISPDGQKLAVLCEDSSVKPIRVYDFRNPLLQPYLELTLSGWTDKLGKSNPYDAQIKWLNSNILVATFPVSEKDQLDLGFNTAIREIQLTVDTVTSASKNSLRANKPDFSEPKRSRAIDLSQTSRPRPKIIHHTRKAPPKSQSQQSNVTNYSNMN